MTASTPNARELLPYHLAERLRIGWLQTMRGPSIWSASPVVAAELDLTSVADVDSAGRSAVASRVSSTLGVGVSDGEEAGEWWAELLVRVATELQRRAGWREAWGRVAPAAAFPSRRTVIAGSDEEVLAEQALREAARILRDCLRGEDPEIDDTVRELTRRYERERPGPTTLAMIEAARRRGIPVRRSPDDGIILLGLGATTHRLRGTMTDRTSIIAGEITSDKHRTRLALQRMGLAVPDGETARTLDGALEVADEIGFPVLLKPLDANNGRGISGRIDDTQGVRDAWPLAAAEHPVVVIERFAQGNEHRVVVVGGRVIACANISTGGAAIDCTDEMHPVNRALCELAAGAVGLDVAGIGVITADISVPFSDNGAVVIDVNASPGIRMHTHPDKGVPRDVPGVILDMLYPPGVPVTIPIIAVTGTNGKTTTTRLIAHLFRTAGRIVGYTTTDGVYFQDHLMMEGDLTGPFAANIVLTHPKVEVAVLETARGGILRAGLGYESCDVAVVTNVTSDHLGLRGIDTVEQLADVKAVVPSVVKEGGHTVLNADDPLVLAMRERTKGRIVLFTMSAPGESAVVEAHLAGGGVALMIEPRDEGEMIVIGEGARRSGLARVADVPLTFGGRARFQVENVLAAVAAGIAQGLSTETICAGLSSFLPSATMTPGRLNVVETSRGRVILDYAHNVAAIQRMLEFVAALPGSRHFALISAPGDRRDEDLRAIGAIATGMDVAIFKEHPHYRRGRRPGEIAQLMMEGYRSAGGVAESTMAFDEEHDAVVHTLGLMQPEDVAVIIADDMPAVMRQLDDYLLPSEEEKSATRPFLG